MSRRKRKRCRRLAATQAGLLCRPRGDRVNPFTEDFGKLSGGKGGRVRWLDRKCTVEECWALAADQWADMPLSGVLHWNNWTAGYTFFRDRLLLRLNYSVTWVLRKHQEDFVYFIRLVPAQTRFGGLRWWFICPLVVNGVPCNRRVGKLYLPSGSRYFGCRHCYQLTYASRQASRKTATSGAEYD